MANMTRKHFEKLAQGIKEKKPNEVASDCLADYIYVKGIWDGLIDSIVIFCKDENERFDEKRFRKACGQ